MLSPDELLPLLELIHGSVECRCYGSMYECDIRKMIKELQSIMRGDLF